VISALEQGEGKTKVARIMNIGHNTLDQWLNRKKEVDNCRTITHYQQGCRHKITDWKRFREFVKEHRDKTQTQVATLWGVVVL
jgi:Transposase